MKRKIMVLIYQTNKYVYLQIHCLITRKILDVISIKNMEIKKKLMGNGINSKNVFVIKLLFDKLRDFINKNFVKKVIFRNRIRSMKIFKFIKKI